MALAATTVLLVAACEDLTEVTNVMPKDEVLSSLTTGDPNYVGAISAWIAPSDRNMTDTLTRDSSIMEYMTWNNKPYPIYLQVSTNSSFPSDQTTELSRLKYRYRYTNYTSGSTRTYYTYRNYQWQLSNLVPQTTYYYRESAVNNGMRVYGPTKQFTTSDYVHLSHIYITPWGSTEGAEQSGTLSNVGLFYGNSSNWFIRNSRNSLTKNNGRWTLPNNISQQYLVPEYASSYRFYLYSPWNQTASESSTNPYITIDVSNAANDNIEYMWGRSSDGKSSAEASITMKNVLAKVTFVVTVQSDATQPFTGYNFTNYALYSTSNNIPTAGYLYITSGYVSGTNYKNLLMRSCSFKYPDAKKELVFRVIPGTIQSNWWLRLMTSKEISSGDYRAQIPSGSWEAGKAYTYNVTISPKGMEIGDVTLTPWDEQPSDSLFVNN
jgi:hypothetical protein